MKAGQWTRVARPTILDISMPDDFADKLEELDPLAPMEGNPTMPKGRSSCRKAKGCALLVGPGYDLYVNAGSV
jgi:hypothetical protein